MSAPRLDIDLDKIQHNARTLVDRLAERGISVTGVTKAVLGSPVIANTLLRGGVSSLADSRIENIETMRDGHILAPVMLIRSPMLSQVERVVRQADLSFNTEIAVIHQLSCAAGRAKRVHGVVLMIELGDLREGIMPVDLKKAVQAVLRLPNVLLCGIGTNLGCLNGVAPDAQNMSELSAMADSVEESFCALSLVSGGNSANLDWALGKLRSGRINNLRLGESILLGCEPLHQRPIEGLHTDAITLVAEVIESKCKPPEPWGCIEQTVLPESLQPLPPLTNLPRPGERCRVILALGHQDVDPSGLLAPAGLTIQGATSDHLVLESSGRPPKIGAEVRFGLTYNALARAMVSPFVTKVMIKTPPQRATDAPARNVFQNR